MRPQRGDEWWLCTRTPGDVEELNRHAVETGNLNEFCLSDHSDIYIFIRPVS